MTDTTNSESESGVKDTGPRPISLVRSKFHGKAFLVPTCVTMVGIFCGFLGVVSAFNGQFEYGARCVLLAFILDGLDGQVARKLNATSDFGKEFDSLSDLVSFGVAPAMLVYAWAFAPFADEFGVLVSFLFVACGATRLARFNIRATAAPKKYFEGLPIPGAAMALLAVLYLWPEQVTSPVFATVALVYVIALSGLMVSTLPYYSLKQLNFRGTLNRQVLAAIGIAVALVWYSPRITLCTGMTLYVMSAPLIWLRFRLAGTSVHEGLGIERPQSEEA